MTDPVLQRVNLLSGDAAARLLRDAVDRCATAGARGLAVFDLDSTLLNNRPRQALIMREFAAEHGVPELREARAEHWEGWDARVAMANAGVPADRIEELFGPFRAYWHERFFTSAYCRVDVPVAGAVAYAGRVAASGARVRYVTGRHEEMRAGTLESFEAAGFPLPSDDGAVDLMMKPTLEETDDAYKARTHAALRDEGEVVLVFDNEPAHVNDYLASFPDALVIHLATDHSMREIFVADGIPSIADFSALG